MPLISPPSALIWDIDGTLIDTTTLIVEALDYVYRKYFDQTLPTEEIRAIIGTPLYKQIRVFGEPEAFGHDESAILNDFIHYYEANQEREVILTDVIAILIEGKQRGLPTGLVTSKNLPELQNTLPRLGIADYVDVIVSADDVQNPKPDPEGMRLALSRLNISESDRPQACYIGDTLHDIHAARGAGIRVLSVTWGAATEERLASAAPTSIVSTQEQLREYLLGE